VFTNFDVVEPDLLYVSNQHASTLLTEKHALGADLVIEIGSPGTRKRDETIKLRFYERAGVPEYWFVDPESNSIRVYRRAGQTFAAPVVLSAERDDVLVTSLSCGTAAPTMRKPNLANAWNSSRCRCANYSVRPDPSEGARHG
jgi:Uma2 family endonuclease